MNDIDDIDNRILHELGRNARIPNTELAGRVGLSPSACLRRVQHLEKIGVIKGYRAVVSPEKTGIGFIAYIAVGLNDHTADAQRAFENSVTKSPAVRECHNITGAFEYILRVETPDLASYKEFHTDFLGALPSLRSINTFVVLESPKDDRA